MKKIAWASLLSLSFNTFAVIYPEGLKSLKVQTATSTATGLWKGADQKFSNFNGDGRTEDYGLALQYGQGLSETVTMVSHIEFRKRSYVAGDSEAGGIVKKGDEISALASIGVGFYKEFFKTNSQSLRALLAFESPGSREAAPGYDDSLGSNNNFLAVSDGFQKYKLGIESSSNFGLVNIDLALTYIFRPGIASDQFMISTLASFNVNKWSFGPMIYMLDTLDGTDIGVSDFGTKNGGKDFTLTKEKFSIAGFFLSKSLASNRIVDFYYHQKISGRNTDKSTSIGAGVTQYF